MFQAWLSNLPSDGPPPLATLPANVRNLSLVIDVVDPATRSRMMASIRHRDTRPEIRLRSALHRIGIRFRLHRKDLAGRPDIVLPGKKIAIFVHGCFWHRHENCRFATTPATRPDFWRAKFEGNVARDARAEQQLLSDGWRVATVWECALHPRKINPTVETLVAWLHSAEARFETATDNNAASGDGARG
jgi:DNA mismatch endonuclease (patch repair protein)